MTLSSKLALVVGGLSIAVLSGCIDQKKYETEPVSVKTPKGTVVCQLYTHKQVLWDEAISVPAGMSIKEGDRVCIAEGKRRLKK